MSITKNKNNICIGAVTTLTLGGTDLGPTSEGGVTLAVEQTTREHMIDQVKGPYSSTVTGRRVTVSLELYEATLANLHKSLNLATSALSGSSLSINDSQAEAAVLIFAGVAPNSGTRTFQLDSVRNIGSINLVTQKNEEAKLAVEFLAYWDDTASRYAIIGDAA